MKTTYKTLVKSSSGVKTLLTIKVECADEDIALLIEDDLIYDDLVNLVHFYKLADENYVEIGKKEGRSRT